jgi:transitional endoplasmic reticulum ATPase
MSRKAQLTELLLRDPFDVPARREFAELLLAERAFEQSLGQWQLVIQQQPSGAAARVAAALCLARLGRRAEAEAQVKSAEACADFDASDPRLAELSPKPNPGGLRVLDGGKAEPPPARVIPIAERAGARFVDVVGMAELKKLLRVRIIEPFLKPGLFQRFRRQAGGGVLLYGPPGCGKTLIARAIAGECKAHFINVGISDVMSMWIGESEKNLSSLFEKARAERPSVVFFDELDALAFSRSKADSDHTRRLVNEFLSQLDGLASDNDQILILAATNMPWDVDPAMKRPGRFDRQVFVPPPDAEARAEMFRVKLHGTPAASIDFQALSGKAENFSGADIDGVIDAAKDSVLAEIVEHGTDRVIEEKDLLDAIGATEASTLDWLRTARNIVKYGGRDKSYKDVESYLRSVRMT